MDAAINQVINDLSEQYGYTYSEASHLLYYGGLKVYLAQDETSWQQRDVADAVGRHVAAVAYGRLEGLELIAVVAAQAVPGGKPHKSLLVL